MTQAKRVHATRTTEVSERREPLSATQARIHFGEVIKRAYRDGEHVIVEKDGIPVVVILSVPEYEQLLRELKLVRFEQASRVAGLEAEQQGLTEEQLKQEMETIKERLYRQAYGR
jgi:prevent-host-death family protein